MEEKNSGWKAREQELLWRLLNCFEPEEDAVDSFSGHIQERFASLCHLCETPREILRTALNTMPLLSSEAAMILEHLGEIVQKSIFTRVESEPIVTAKAARDYVAASLLTERREMAVFFALDEGFRVFNAYILDMGIVDETTFRPYTLLDVGLKLNARYVLLAHNHPGRDGKPSFSDVDATKNALCILARAGMPVVDHVVVARGRGISLRADGKIDDSLWTAQGNTIPSREMWMQAESP